MISGSTHKFRVMFLVLFASYWPVLCLSALIVTYAGGISGATKLAASHSVHECTFVPLLARNGDLIFSGVPGLDSVIDDGRYCTFRGHLSVPFITTSR